MRAHVYVRISQDRTGQKAGVTRQRDECERRAGERGWTVTAVHTDNDQSATTGRRRPGFEAMLSAIDSGEAEVVVAWSLDRLQRNRRDELRLYEMCRDKGATLSLVNGADLDFSTAAGRFVADSLGSVARLEVEMKSDRQRLAVEQAAAKGKRVGGRRPFGFDLDGVTVREDEAALIRSAYSDHLAGVSLGAIARRWNASGLLGSQKRWKGARDENGRPTEAAPWKHDTVRTVLRNPRYAGKRALRGEIVAEAEWPALVPEETWRAVRAMLDDRASRTAPRAAKHLLTGVAVCGVCGATLHAGGSARRGVPGLRCSAAWGHVTRMAEPVEQYVVRQILDRLSRDDAAELLHDDKAPDVDALRERATALRTRLDSVAVEFADGVLTASQVRTITARIREQLDETEAALADAGRVNVLGPLVSATDPREVWDSLPLDHRRAVIDLMAVVTVFPPGRGRRTFDPRTVDVEPKF